MGLLDTTDRTLRRRFHAAVGYGPKTFQRIMRFQGLLALSRAFAADQPGLTGLALASGFTDHSHMCREVLELSGRTPGVLLEGRYRA